MPRRGLMPLLVVVAMWAAVWIPPAARGKVLPARDLAATHIPWRAVWAHQVRSGTAPLWDPNSNQGRPLLANPNSMAAYPGTILFALLDLETAEVLHIAAHHLILLGGLYVLARRTGASSAAATVAAATIGTSGVVWSATTFLNVLAALSWAPWALAQAAQAPADSRSAGRRTMASGTLVGLSFLAGEPLVAALAALVCTACVLAAWPRAHWPRALLAVPTAIAVGGPVLVPLLSMYPGTVRGFLGVSPGALAADALAPRRLIELILPNSLGAPLGGIDSGFWAEASFPWQRYYPTIFVGSLTIFLLPLAWSPRRDLRVWWGVVLGGGAVAVGLGFPAIAARVEALPGASNIRFSIKLLVAVMLALAPLVAAGWDRLAQMSRQRLALTSAFALAPTLALTLAAGPLQPHWRAALGAAYPASARALDKVAPHDLRAAMLADCAALALPPLALVAAGPAPAIATGVAFVAGWIGGRAVLLFDNAARWSCPPPSLGVGGMRPPIVASLVTTGSPEDGPLQPELRRFWAARSVLAPGYATRWGARYVLTRGPDGLEPLQQELVSARAASLTLAEQARLARALGATLLVADSPVDGWIGGWVEGTWVGTLADPVPEAYLARRLLPAEGVVAAVQSMVAVSFRPGEDAVTEGEGGAEWVAAGTVRASSGVPHHRTFAIHMDGSGFLVFQQSYLPAWRARIDGRDAEVELANGALVGVRVPAGVHSVEIFLSPTPYRLGACGPFLLLAVVSLPRAAAAWRGRRRSSGAAAHSTPASLPTQ